MHFKTWRVFLLPRQGPYVEQVYGKGQGDFFYSAQLRKKQPGGQNISVLDGIFGRRQGFELFRKIQ